MAPPFAPSEIADCVRLLETYARDCERIKQECDEIEVAMEEARTRSVKETLGAKLRNKANDGLQK